MNTESNVAALRQPPTTAEPVETGSPELAGLFKALGDPLRLQILRALRDDSLSVSELCEVFQLRQSALSHHLKVLVQGDVLVRRREGTAIFYQRQLPDDHHEALIHAVLSSVDSATTNPELEAGLERVYARREQNSLSFFRDNSESFKEQQELIASWQDYSQGALHLLDRCGLPPTASILEIGPGDGTLLPALAARAGKVTALDNSASMLASARSTAGDLDKVVFTEGEPSILLERTERFDAVVANMVLHHTPHPDQVLAEAGALSKPGGFLVVSDLCAHDQAWAREHCGDLWLGFEPAQLTDWALAAGLEDCAELFIAQRNGFQVQVRLFRHPLPTSNTQTTTPSLLAAT